MRMRIIYLPFLFFGVLLSSCSKEWLDKKPSNSIATPSTLKDFQAILDNPQLYQNSPGLGELATDGHYLQEASFLSRSDIERNAYTWSQTLPYIKVTDWTTSYSIIFDINIVLGELDKLSTENSSDRIAINNLKGQARFYRSKTFYELTQIFAPPFLHSTASKELGIVLHLEADLNNKSVRSTLKETYDQIIHDLMLAKDELPLQQEYKTRPSRIAVFSMLSRVFLSMEDYDMAKAYADSALNNYNTLMDFNSLITSSTFPIPRLNSEVIYHSTMIPYSSIGSQLRIEQKLRDAYPENDLRGKAYFGSNNGLVTFKGSYNGARISFTGLSTNELYLNRAECYARAGKLEEAMKDLNDLIKTRWRVVDGTSTYVNQVAMNKADALGKILEERKRELLIRGLRWTDLRRLNNDPLFAETLTRTIANNTFTLEPNSYKYTFPIPADIVQVSGIQQNPGWND